MLEGKRIAVVMPAYNAALTLEKTLREINREIVDEIILVDDCSRDDTVAVAKRLGLRTLVHDRKRAYGGQQKNCHPQLLRTRPHGVGLRHPDYQYTPQLIPPMASLI